MSAPTIGTTPPSVTPTRRFRCALAAAALVVVIFADVVFLRGSLSPIDYGDNLVADRPGPPVSLLPHVPGRAVEAGWGDTGSAAYQMQPAQRFLAYCLRSGESAYWDPYTATGMTGPETVVDVKFSVVSVIFALLGGWSDTFTFVLLALYFCGAYALLRVFTDHLGLSLLAAVAAAAAFILNGFALMNLNSAIGQPYFLGPILLASLLPLSRRFTWTGAALSVLAHAAMFSVTFFPTMVLTVLGVHAIALTVGFTRQRAGRDRSRLLAYQAAIPFVAVGLMAFLYLPVFETYLRYVDTWAIYDRRVVDPVAPINLLSLFTPKHFWESYRSMWIDPAWPRDRYEMWVPHLGIVPALIGAHALFRRNAHLALAAVCLGLIVVAEGKVFGAFPFTLFQHVPFFSFIRNEYWPALTMLAFTVLVALGFDALRKETALRPAAMALLAALGLLFGVLATRLSFPAPALANILVCAGVLVASAGSLLWLRVGHGARLGAALKLLLLVGVLAEGLYYMNTRHPVRSNRDRELPASVAWIKARIPGAGGDRVLDIGTAGVYPNWGSALQLPELGSLVSGESPRYRTFYSHHIGVGLFLSLRDPGDDLRFTDASLSLVGVRYVIVDRSHTPAVARVRGLGYPLVQEDAKRLVFENPHPMPRAFAVPALVRPANADALPHQLSSSARLVATTTDPKLEAQAAELGIASAVAPSLEPAGTVDVESYHHDAVNLRVSLTQPAVVVMTDNWHPNWTARVDGRDAYVGHVDVAFRGIALARGEHRIEFRYAPRTKRLGEVLSGATALAMLLAVAWGSRRRPGTRVIDATRR